MKQFWKTILFSIIILILCLLPSSGTSHSRLNIPHFDKILHFGFYFMLSVIFVYEIRLNHVNRKKSNKSSSKFRKIVIVFLYCVVLGLLIEILQHYLIASRSDDLLDLVADTLGAIFGIVFMRIFNIILKSK